MKKTILALIFLASVSNAWAGVSEWKCEGEFSDGDNPNLSLSFVYQQMSGLDENSEAPKFVQAVTLAEYVYIDPVLLCEDTSNWDLDELINFKTNYVTDYPEADCGTPDGRNKRISFTFMSELGKLRLNVRIAGGDGYGEAITLTGICTEVTDF